MTEHKIENNWYNNIAHLLLQFSVSWIFVGYIRIHILNIPYTIYNDHSYNFIASFICTALLYFFVYKRYLVKISLDILFLGIFISILSGKSYFMYSINVFEHFGINMDYYNEKLFSPYTYISKTLPMAAYLLSFINKKAFIIFMTINFVVEISYFYI
jgi:glucan phosphoethanolaminetransferase (alkaline phosphatase superfamily)